MTFEMLDLRRFNVTKILLLIVVLIIIRFQKNF